MNTSDVLSLIGDLAALAAALFAYLALRKASETVREARAERLAAEHDRLVRRIEAVAGAVSDIAALAEADLRYNPATESWLHRQNRLSFALAGLGERLPTTAGLLKFRAAPEAASVAILAREEISHELERLAQSRAT